MDQLLYSSLPYTEYEGRTFEIDEKRLSQYLTLGATSSSDYLLDEKIEVRYLRRRDIRQASRTLEEATKYDPLTIYMRETPDARNPRLYKRIEHFIYALALSQWSRKTWGLTVNHGRAVVCGRPALETSKKAKLDGQIDGVLRLIVRVLNRIGKSKLQRQRLDEVNKKLDKFVEEMLGADAKRMRTVDSLATSPDFQRRGYGGALVDAITKAADNEGISTYLLSSNPAANTEFYNAHGFFTIAELLIGDDDPTWKAPPIPIPLMVRTFGDQ